MHIHLCKDLITGSGTAAVDSLKVMKHHKEVALRNVWKAEEEKKLKQLQE